MVFTQKHKNRFSFFFKEMFQPHNVRLSTYKKYVSFILIFITTYSKLIKNGERKYVLLLA